MSEEKEESLSPHAAGSRASIGRLRPEEPSPIRTAFQRDRDRILHCNAFRRLKHKTQVFIAPHGDHYVTRLTHTLEVSQIARTISRALNLNEDLTEAIALGHDLGHTPFGHIGEEVLNELYPGGFRHNEQSLRVVDVLENNGRGLNLTHEVRDGILHHSKSTSAMLNGWGTVETAEGEVVRIADAVAYVNHDIDDAIRARVISPPELPEITVALLGHTRSERINNMVGDIIIASWSVRSPGSLSRPAIKMSPDVTVATEELRRFLFDRVYNAPAVRQKAPRSRAILRRLYRYFQKYPEELPIELRANLSDESRRVVDHIAGMTDQFATHLAGQIPPVRSWI
jgi:dGTPase